MKTKKIITVSLAAALAIGALTANGVLVSADAEKGTIKVAASATPHAEILEEAKPILEKEGWDLEVTVFDDYVQPNLVVERGDFDANYFQYIPYLDNFNEEQGTHLVNAGGIHYEPFGIYPGKKEWRYDRSSERYYKRSKSTSASPGQRCDHSERRSRT